MDSLDTFPNRWTRKWCRPRNGTPLSSKLGNKGKREYNRGEDAESNYNLANDTAVHGGIGS